MYSDTINIVFAFRYSSVKLLWRYNDNIPQRKHLLGRVLFRGIIHIFVFVVTVRPIYTPGEFRAFTRFRLDLYKGNRCDSPPLYADERETLCGNKNPALEIYKHQAYVAERDGRIVGRVVAIINHASNVCGVLAPIAEICALSKAHGAINIIDMCQTMGLVDTNLNNDNIDYAVFAAHKTLYGPMGLGGFICPKDAELVPLMYGGTGTDSSNPNLPVAIPERYEVGTLNLSAIAGLNAALKWIGSVGIDAIYRKEQANRRRLLGLLSKYGNIKIVPKVIDEDSAIGVISCVFDGFGSDNIGQILSDKDVAVRTGLHCAPNTHQFLGTSPAGTIRFSVGYFNTDSDFERLEEALNYIYENS